MYRHPVHAIPSLGRLASLLAGAATLPLLLGACSGGSTSGSTTTGPSVQPHTASACSLVTTARIEQTLGKMVRGPRITNSARSTVCTYPSNVSADTVIVGFKAKVTESDAVLEQARLEKLHGTLTDVSGPGFSAYYYSDASARPPVIGLVTINGMTQVTVTSTATLTQQEALTQQIFATLASQATGATTTTSATATP